MAVRSLPRALVERRLEFVANLMVRYPETETVIRLAASAPDADLRMPRRTCARYVARVRERWSAETTESLGLRRAKHRRALARLRDKAEQQGDLRTASTLAVKEAEIDGAFELPADRDAGIETVDERRGSWAATEVPE